MLKGQRYECGPQSSRSVAQVATALPGGHIREKAILTPLQTVSYTPYSQETDKINRTGRQISSLKHKDGQTTKNHQATEENKHGNRSIKFNKERKYRKDICKIF